MRWWCSTTCSCRGRACFCTGRGALQSGLCAHGAVVHMTTSGVKNIAKAEFMMGLASLLVNSIGVDSFQHIHEKLAEIWVGMETMKAFCAPPRPTRNSTSGRHASGVVAARCGAQSLPRLYRDVEIIQQIGASGLSPCQRRPISTVPRGRHQALLPGSARRGLRPDSSFRLAWDHRCRRSAPGSALRAIFLRDPVRMAGALVADTAGKFRCTPIAYRRSSARARRGVRGASKSAPAEPA